MQNRYRPYSEGLNNLALAVYSLFTLAVVAYVIYLKVQAKIRKRTRVKDINKWHSNRAKINPVMPSITARLNASAAKKVIGETPDVALDEKEVAINSLPKKQPLHKEKSNTKYLATDSIQKLIAWRRNKKTSLQENNTQATAPISKKTAHKKELPKIKTKDSLSIINQATHSEDIYRDMSCQRRLASRTTPGKAWMPAFAGMTNKMAKFDKHSFRSTTVPQKKEKIAAAAIKVSAAKTQSSISVSHAAKYKINLDAKYLLSFSYPSENTAQIKFIELIKGLAFFYHFHRYNLSRRILANDNEEAYQAVNLRTLIVHTTKNVELDKNIILDTQKQMKAFLPTETAKLIQHHSLYFVKSDQHQSELVKLSGHSIGEITFYSIKTTPLYGAINRFSDHVNEQNVTHDKDFLPWMKNQLIPFINLVNSHLSCRPTISSITQDEYLSAMKMLIIILGEYCTNSRCVRIKRQFPTDESATIKLMQLCRKIRNKLSHTIFDLDNNELKELLFISKSINPLLLTNFNTSDVLLMKKSTILRINNDELNHPSSVSQLTRF